MKIHEHSEQGTIIVLFALLLITLLAIIALAIDLGLAFAGHSKQDIVSKQVALAALEAYTDASQEPNLSYDERISRSLARARTVAGLGRNLLLVNGMLQRPKRPNQHQRIDFPGAFGPFSDGELIAGRYWITRPDCENNTWQKDGSEACACDQPKNTLFKPCFGANPSSPVPDRQTGKDIRSVNAFQALLQLPGDGLLKTQFMRVVGQSTVQFRSSAIAAFVPKRVIVAVDLSRSMSLRTHLAVDPDNLEGKLAAEYAYPLDPSWGDKCFNDFSAPPCVADGELDNCNFRSGYYAYLWSKLPAQRPSEGSFEETQHFRSDYACVEISMRTPPLNEPFGPNFQLRTEKYLVDTYHNAQQGYFGARPLSDALRAVHNLLELLSKRAVGGDRFGFVGFDATVLLDPQDPKLQPRVVELIPPNPNDLGRRRFAELLDITNVSEPNGARQRLEKMIHDYLLIPRNSAYTSVPLALQQARAALATQRDFALAQNFIILVTDGLSNCRTGSDGENPGCQATLDYHLGSLNEASIITDRLKRDNIVVHTVLLDGSVTPHTLARQSILDPSKCMSATEHALLNDPDISYVDSESFPEGVLPEYCYPENWDKPPNCPGTWYYPNRLYLSSLATGGLFLPIRNPCRLNGNVCDAEPALHSACSKLDTRKEKSPLLTDFVWQSQALTDEHGRLLCDPLCRGQSEQIQDAVDAIMGDNPFVLVAEGG